MAGVRWVSTGAVDTIHQYKIILFINRPASGNEHHAYVAIADRQPTPPMRDLHNPSHPSLGLLAKGLLMPRMEKDSWFGQRRGCTETITGIQDGTLPCPATMGTRATERERYHIPARPLCLCTQSLLPCSFSGPSVSSASTALSGTCRSRVLARALRTPNRPRSVAGARAHQDHDVNVVVPLNSEEGELL